MVQIPSAPPPPFLPPDEELRQKLDEEQVKIQVVLFITFLIYTMILILGRLRSRGNSTMKLISTNSFFITGYLISFIPGLMSGPGESNDLYIFWMAFMAYLAAVTNEISCYTLGDNEARKKRLIIDYAVVWPLILNSLYQSLASPEIIVPILIIFCVVVSKLRERSRALLYATKSSNGFSQATKVISDYAKYRGKDNEEIHNSNSSYNNLLVGVREAQKMAAKQMKIGSTLIDFDRSNPKVITLDKVLDPNETFLVSTKEGKELQNTCISFAMFWSLLAKVAGYKNVDANTLKVGNKLPYNSFEFVEKELGFLYDYLFTNYYAIYERGFWKKLRDICLISLFFWLTLPLFVEYRAQDHNILYVILWGRVLDTGFTRFVILAILIIEFVQIAIFLTSKWAKVMYTCSYLRNQSVWETTGSKNKNFLQRVIKIACFIPRPRLSLFCFSTSTKRKIGQYSILKCFSKIPKPMWLECWIGSYFDLPRLGQSGNRDIDLSLELQESILKAIDTSLGRHEGKITNGVFALKNLVSDDDHIIDTYVKNVTSQARVILIWHLATGLFEADVNETSPSSNRDDNFETATIISNYCAYLVAFFPKMLPDHVYTTQCEFDQAVRELDMEKLEDDDRENPKTGLNGDNSILEEARKLKEKLQGLQPPNLWKTLAEFWIEMLLYLALSDHGEAIEAHADSLCIGGEFITHIWALLTHAGCSRMPFNS